MKAAGLRPGGSEGGWFQPFTFLDGVVVGAGNALSVATPAGQRAFVAGEDFRPLAFSAAGTAGAEIVFAGYGMAAKDLDYDDYAGWT